MNVSKISATPFKGTIQVDGDIKIFYKGEKLEKKEQLSKSGRHIRNLFSGSTVRINNLENVKVRKSPDSPNLVMTGLVEIDTDRIAAITPTDIELRSEDGNTLGFIAYNKNNDKLRQILAINAYQTASNSTVLISIDE